MGTNVPLDQSALPSLKDGNQFSNGSKGKFGSRRVEAMMN